MATDTSTNNGRAAQKPAGDELRAYSRNLRAHAVQARHASTELRASCEEIVEAAKRLSEKAAAGGRIADARRERARVAVARALGRD
jgi:hypothetical protein